MSTSEGAKVLLTTQAIKTDSTFRAKALRRELVWWGGGGRESTRVFIQVNILKQHVTK